MARLNSKIVRVGAGGWLEYKTNRLGGQSTLREYSKEFDFVEINSTFYRIMQPHTIELWRRSVPAIFEFSVKCYKALTHEIGLRPVEDAFRVFSMMQNYCKILDANILVMQTPPTLKLDDKFVGDARAFFNSAKIDKLRIAFEFRTMPGKMSTNLAGMLRDFNMIHTIDLTFEDPRFESNLLYSRVFGRPEKGNMLDDRDLERIKTKVERSESHEVRIVGHSLKMIDDTRKIKQALFA
jgi:uncharacterized protein YecE (DUF72 family)